MRRAHGRLGTVAEHDVIAENEALVKCMDSLAGRPAGLPAHRTKCEKESNKEENSIGPEEQRALSL
jgi:hypothetical protein